MSTIGEYFEARSRDATNNFLALRLLAASLVIYGHAPALSAACPSCKDLFARLGYRYSGDVGLHIFFVISGFLVFASFAQRNSLKDFLLARFLRIAPALWMCLIICVGMSAFFSTLDIAEFFRSPETANYLVQNGSLHQAQFHLPGVVFSSNAKYGGVVNGPIWSLFIEARLYLMIAVAGSLGAISRRSTSNVILGAIVLLGLIDPQRLPFIGEYSENWRLAAFFAAGVFCYVNRYSIPLKAEIFFLLILCAILSKDTPNFEWTAGAALVYGTFLVGFARKFKMPDYIQDYSYGIYLYGWPVSQLIAHYLPGVGPKGLTSIALPLSWGLGALSWHLLEKRALRLKPRKVIRNEVNVGPGEDRNSPALTTTTR